MNILFMARLYNPHIGGVEKHVEKISLELIKKGHKVTVLTEKFDKKLSNYETIDKINIARIDAGGDNWFKKFRIWVNVLNNIKLIRDANIIHVHDVFFWYLPFRFIFPRKKIYITFHGYEGNSIPGVKAKLMHKIAEKLSNGNICVGDFLKKWYGTKPDYVIYGGVDIPSKLKIKNTYFVEDFVKREKFKILFIGRLEEETGFMEYLRALKLLKKRSRQFEITILGDGFLMRKAKEFCIKHEINAVFKGSVKNVDSYVVKSDLIFTSRYLGILEALSFKKFVFANFNNAIKKDYLEMTPFAKYISISKDHKDLLNQIEYYLKNNQNRNEMVDRGFNWAKNQTWDNLVLKYMKLWRKE